MLGHRVLTAVIGGALFLAVLWQGGLWWTGLWTVLAAIGAFEFTRILRHAEYRLPGPPLIAAAAALAGLGHLWAGGVPPGTYVAIWQGLVLLFFGLPLFTSAYDFRSSAAAQVGLIYTGWLPAAIVALGGAGRGALLGFWLTIWLTDIGAYFGGRLFGRHKLIVRISPGKTWEGALVGTAVAVLAIWALSPVLSRLGGFPAGAYAALFAFVIAVLGQVGDLVESVLKRHGGVKDSGRLLPGHGGVLDRFDSALFAAPVAALLLTWLQG